MKIERIHSKYFMNLESALVEFGHKINEIIDTINTLSEAHKPPQEESKCNSGGYGSSGLSSNQSHHKESKVVESCDCQKIPVRICGVVSKMSESQIRADERKNVVSSIKDKSEKVTNHLWYVANEHLEDLLK